MILDQLALPPRLVTTSVEERTDGINCNSYYARNRIESAKKARSVAGRTAPVVTVETDCPYRDDIADQPGNAR